MFKLLNVDNTLSVLHIVVTQFALNNMNSLVRRSMNSPLFFDVI